MIDPALGSLIDADYESVTIMNNRPGSILTLLAFIFFAPVITFTAYSGQQTGGKSTGSISGHVTSAKKALSGIEVQLLERLLPGKGLTTRFVAAVTTDDQGHYQFAGVDDGTYDVVPVTDLYFVSDPTQDYHAGKIVTVASGQQIANINFDMPMFGKIEGQIRDSNGRPVKQYSVDLWMFEKNHEKSRLPDSAAIVKPSDDNGNYSIEKVPPGSYIVSCGHPITYSLMLYSDVEKHPIYPQAFHPGTADIARASEVEVRPGATITGVDITLEPPIKTYRIAGRVIDEQTGEPIPKESFTIVYQDSNGQKTEGKGPQWDSNSKGEFKIPGLLPGHIFFEPGPNVASNTYSDPIEMDITDKDITGLEIKMHRASTLSGQVVIDTSDGNAKTGKLAPLNCWAVLYLKDEITRPTIKADIEPDGRFRFTGLFPGVFKFRLDSMAQSGLREVYLLRVERDGQELPDGIEIRKGEDLTGLRLVVRTTRASGGPIPVQAKVKVAELERMPR